MSPDTLANLLNQQPLDAVPLWLFYILTVALFLLAIEGGYRLSQARQRKSPDHGESIVGSLNGATLALLAFLLAFVVGVALNSLADRRSAVVTEANAIGTTYLRAGYLPEPYATESQTLLREYTALRVVERGTTQEQVVQGIARSEAIHGELWSLVEGLVREQSSPTIALYVSSLNEVIDLHTVRLNVELVARLPAALVLALYFIAILALGLVGLHAGYADRRNPIALVSLALVLSVVFILIIDLNRNTEGLLQVSQQAMIDLRNSIRLEP